MKWSGVLGAGLLGFGLLGASAAEAAELPFQPCGSQRSAPRIECGSVTVPLDRHGLLPGQIRLALQRVPARRPEVRLPGEAVLVLAGGPGQSATGFTRQETDGLRPLLGRRDLLTLDTRGTGRSSDLIVCRDLQDPARTRIPASVKACAAQLAGAAGSYGTGDIVEDIEAVRQALGYDRLWLVGTSYGTYTAQRYAVAHPDRVAGLVLDSVVDPAADNWLSLRAVQAIPRVLAQGCLGGACRRATDDVRRDFAATLARLPLRGHYGDSRGRRIPLSITEDLLLGLIVSIDENPLIAPVLPSALRRAAQGDGEPLGRLLGLSLLGQSADKMTAEEILAAARQFSDGNWVATSCRDARWPWSAETPVGNPRLAAARAFVRQLDPKDLGGFDGATLLGTSLAEYCAWWPTASDATPPGPLPRVPTLLISGRDDLITPTEDAVAVARRAPGAQLLTVPGQGHSVLTADLPCVKAALRAIQAAQRVRPCPSRRPSRALATPPRSARELGRMPAARARAAAQATVDDAFVSVAFWFVAIVQRRDIGPRIAGLRGGYLSLGDEIALHRLQYVPRVAVSGRFDLTGPKKPPRRIRVRVSGGGVRAGTYRVSNPFGDVESFAKRIGAESDPQPTPASKLRKQLLMPANRLAR